MKLCLIEDDLLLGKALTAALNEAGYRVTWVRTAADADRWLAQGGFDTAVLDLGLPDGDGMAVLGRIRRDWPNLPVAIITARDSLQTRIDGLDAGADDLLVKPFATAELLARLRAIQRRSDRSNGSGSGANGMPPGAAGSSADDAASPPLVVADLVLDEMRRTCRRGDVPIALSPTEFALLHHLLLNKNRVRTRRQLEAGSMPDSHGLALDAHMSNLRRKIGADLIRTVRGVGYVIEEPA